MPSFRISGSRFFAPSSSFLFVVFFVFLCGALGIHGQTSNKAAAAEVQNEVQNEAPYKLKTTSNLVVVRVVVRDAQGRPVENLKKEDFKLLDRGKEQSIEQFEVETSAAAPPPSSAAGAPPRAIAPTRAMPVKFTAFYFDDMNTSDADMVQARDAADHYLSANLRPGERVAIFTSEQMLSDFTSDLKQIHDALFKLHASARNVTRTRGCPELSDEQAAQINQFPNNLQTDAWVMALNEAATCEGGVLSGPSSGGGGGGSISNTTGQDNTNFLATVIRTRAQIIVGQIGALARANLQELEHAVNYVSQMPGERSVILVSPGFMAQSEQFQVDRLIDRALRSQVVVSSLDPKGLAILMREMDASRSNIPANNASIVQATRRSDSERELVATGVLADVAYGTGGEFFHNNNDLKAGFGALAGSPTYYILAFTPNDMKIDGKFHALRVTLAAKQPGLTVQARRGYFAAQNQPEAPVEVATKPQAAPPNNPEDQAQEQIREAVLAKTEIAQLPVGLDTKLADGQGETRELSLSAHLDGSSLHFKKDGEHNLNTVTFVFAVFDQKENLLEAQMRHAKVNILDTQVPSFTKTGVDMHLTFQLKPGTYRIREVVSDSEDHHMTTVSRNVTIP